MKEQIWKQILAVRQSGPLVHSITNYVVMNNTANALLAVGASPIMAHAHPEMRDMVNIAGVLVVNIGTLDEYWVESMHIAIEQANALDKPWVLDPVGAGATPYRNEVLNELLAFRPTVIRGNASEIMSLARQSGGKTKGVDSIHQSSDAILSADVLTRQFGSVVCVSGAIDMVIQGSQQIQLDNGDALMAKVTGLGCTATALTGAFVAANPHDVFMATTSAMALLGVAGELAATEAKGPGSLQALLLDKLYNLTEAEFMTAIKVHVK